MWGLLRIIPPPKGGKPPDQAKGVGPAGPVVAMMVLAITGIVVADNLMHGSPSLGLLNFAVIACSALIIGGVLTKGMREAMTARRQLDRLPDLPNPEDELHRTQQMRAKAAQLRTPPSVVIAPEVGLPEGYVPPSAALAPPPGTQEARGETADPVAAPVPRVASIRQLREEKLEDERLLRVAAILIVSCPLCGTGEAELCKPVAGMTWYQLDKDRGLYAHSLRIIKAVLTGTARLDDVAAQFNDDIPDPILGALI